MNTELSNKQIEGFKTERRRLLKELAQDFPEEVRIGIMDFIYSKIEASEISMTPVSPCAIYIDRADTNEMIVANSVRILRDLMPRPSYAREIVQELRKAQVPLPSSDGTATAKVSAIFGKRPDVFRRYPGKSPAEAARWHLAEGEPFKLTEAKVSIPSLSRKQRKPYTWSEEGRARRIAAVKEAMRKRRKRTQE